VQEQSQMLVTMVQTQVHKMTTEDKEDAHKAMLLGSKDLEKSKPEESKKKIKKS